MAYIEKLENFWRTLISSFKTAETLEGATLVCNPEIPLYVLNHAACIKSNEDDCSKLINRVEEYFRLRQLPFVCFRTSSMTRPKSFVSLLESASFEPKSEQSVMVLKKAEITENENAKVVIKRVNSYSDVDVFDKLMLTIFEMPTEWKRSFDEFTRICMQSGWRFYLANYLGKPVGTCALFSSGKIGGIFNVGTLPEYRKMGIGTALTLQALRDSADSGNKVHTLQAETGGNAQRLYEKVGFEVDHLTRFFAKQIMAEKLLK